VTSRADRSPDIRVQFIRKGQLATFEVEGGFARKPAPSDGLLIELTTTSLFLPVEQIRRAGLEVAERPRTPPRQPDHARDDVTR
jgi:hypothetical protein